MRVLVADDEALVRYLLTRHLADWGHEVVATSNGQDAWERFQEGEFHLVISDWMMPGMDGLELIRRIRADERFAYVYLILLTAKSRTEDVVEGMEAGADDFLSKPFHRDELRVRLQAAERTVRLEHDLAERNRQLVEYNSEITAANRRMTRDMQAGASVQQAMLPIAQPGVLGADFAWKLRPCAELAGDILNVFPLDDRHVGLYILDVSGHGVPAALLSFTVSWYLSRLPGASAPSTGNDRPTSRLLDPVEVATLLNQRFGWDHSSRQFFTLIYGVLNCETGRFRFVTAGHPGPVYVPRDGEPTVISVSAFPIGIVEDAVFAEKTIEMQPGDRLYLYTDGITEAFDCNGEPFGDRGLLQAMEKNASLPLESSVDALFDSVYEWSCGKEVTDDASVVALEFVGAGQSAKQERGAVMSPVG